MSVEAPNPNLSTRSNPITKALAIDAIDAAIRNQDLEPIYSVEIKDMDIYKQAVLACSGLTFEEKIKIFKYYNFRLKADHSWSSTFIKAQKDFRIAGTILAGLYFSIVAFIMGKDFAGIGILFLALLFVCLFITHTKIMG